MSIAKGDGDEKKGVLLFFLFCFGSSSGRSLVFANGTKMPCMNASSLSSSLSAARANPPFMISVVWDLLMTNAMSKERYNINHNNSKELRETKSVRKKRQT